MPLAYQNTASYNDPKLSNISAAHSHCSSCADTSSDFVHNSISDEFALEYDIDEKNTPHILTTYTTNTNTNTNIQEIVPQMKVPDEITVHWDTVTHFYFGSLTVIGLFIVFRLMQKSR